MLQKYFKGIYEGLLGLNTSVKVAFVLDSYSPSGLDKDAKFLSEILETHEQTLLNRLTVAIDLDLDQGQSNSYQFATQGRSNPQITFSTSATSAQFKYMIFYKEVTDDTDSPVISVITFSTNQTVTSTEDKFLSGSTTANSNFSFGRYYMGKSLTFTLAENYFRKLLKGETHLTGSSAPEYKCSIVMGLNFSNSEAILSNYLAQTDNLHLSDLGTPMISFDGARSFDSNRFGYISNSLVANNVIAFETYTDDTLNRIGVRVSSGTSNFVLNTPFSTGSNEIMGIIVWDDSDPDPAKKDIVGVFYITSLATISNTKAEVEISGKNLFYIQPNTTF